MNLNVSFNVSNTEFKPTFSNETVGFLPIFEQNIVVTQAEYYEGATVVVPMRTEQILHTKNKTMPDNVIVTKIPNNYGLITFNGGIITVS